MSRWVLLRGLTREARHWGDFPRILTRALPGAQLYTPDLPGNGALCTQDSPLGVAAMVEALRARLLAQGVVPPYHLLALSLGAMVALAWAARYPDEVAGAVLVNTSLRRFSPFYRRLRPANYAWLLRLMLRGGSDQQWEATILALTSRQTRSDAATEALLGRWLAYRAEHPVSVRNTLRQLFAAAVYRAPREKPPVPLLIVSSRGDALVNADCSRRIAERWHLPHAQHPDAGHDLPLDDGPWLAAEVARWLARRRATGTPP